MPEIQWIKNVTTFAAFSNTPAVWSQQISGFPNENPDVVIIRSVTWAAPTSNSAYLVWCDFLNAYIGSFSGETISGQYSGMTFIINSPVPNHLTFQLHEVQANGSATTATVLGNVIVHLEFVKYHRIRPHA